MAKAQVAEVCLFAQGLPSRFRCTPCDIQCYLSCISNTKPVRIIPVNDACDGNQKTGSVQCLLRFSSIEDKNNFLNDWRYYQKTSKSDVTDDVRFQTLSPEDIDRFWTWELSADNLEQQQCPGEMETEERQKASRTVQMTVGGVFPLSEDIFLNHFEVTRNGGEPDCIDDVKIDEKSRKVQIVFKDPRVAQRVIEKDHSIARQPVTVTMMQLREISEEEKKANRTVEIKIGGDFPLSEDIFANHFESKRYGGGIVEDVLIDDDERIVHVVFETEEMATFVAGKKWTLAKQVVIPSIMTFTPPSEEEIEAQRTVEISTGEKFPLSEDIFQNYFESSRRYWGVVERVEVDEDNHIVRVVFENPEVARNVAQEQHTIARHHVDIKMTTYRKPTKEEIEARRTVEMEVDEGIPLSDDIFINHFESSKNVGGRVERVDIEGRKVHVIFEDENVARAVCSKQHKIAGYMLSPSMLNIKKLSHGSSACHQKTQKQTAALTHSQRPEDRIKKGSKLPETKNILETEEKEARKTVELSAPKAEATLSEDEIASYFKKQGFGVLEVMVDPLDKIVHVIFQDEKAAKVAEKSEHYISGTRVYATMFKYRACYPDKLLFRNVPEDVSPNCLELFIRKTTGLKPREILHGENMIALASFDETVDIRKTNKACRQQILDGRKLVASKVPISNCVMVSNLSPAVSKDYLTLYFDKFETEGVKVGTVEMKPEDRRAFVYFEDPAVIPALLEMPHALEDNKLELQLYLECLGENGGTPDPTVFTMPQPLFLRDLEPNKLQFLLQSEQEWTKVAQSLQDYHAKAVREGDGIYITCLLRKDVPRVRHLARTWPEDVENAVKTLLSQLEMRKRRVLETIWNEAQQKIKTGAVSKAGDAILFFSALEAEFIVVGKKHEVEKLYNTVEQIIGNVEQEVEKRNKEITDRKNLKPFKLDFLRAMSFQRLMQEKYPELKVEILEQEIEFQGNMEVVMKGQNEMFQHLENICTQNVSVDSENLLRFYEVPQAREYISNKLREGGRVITWEVDLVEQAIILHALKKKEIPKAKALVLNSLQEKKVGLDPESCDLLRTPQWQNMLENIKEISKQGFATVQNGREEITVIATENIVEKVAEEITVYLDVNTIYTEKVSFGPCRQRFIIKFMVAKVTDIEKTLAEVVQSVKIMEQDNAIEVKGRRQGLDKAKQKLEELGKSIVCVEETFRDSAQLTFLQSNSCIDDLEGRAIRMKCVFGFRPESPVMQTRPKAGTHNRTAKAKMGVKVYSMTAQYKGVWISSVEGDITQMDVDVIVNAANDRLQHGAGLAKDIVDKGGYGIQTECDQLMQTSGRLSDGDVVPSGPGSLRCKSIFHAVGPVYRDGRSGEAQCLQKTITRCLQMAVGKQYTSISLPAISSGIFGYPPHKATQEIVHAVKAFVDDHQPCPVQEVYLCVIDSKMLEHFDQAVQSCFPGIAVNAREAIDEDGFPTHGTDDGERKGLTARILKGQIAEQQVDVIVNSTDQNLNLSTGAVSGSILQGAGDRMQNECKVKYPGGIGPSRIATTGGYNLRCKEVFHIVLPRWADNSSQVLLAEMITKCLSLANDHQHKAIAFPVLGTGSLGFPHNVVARTMLDAVRNFRPSGQLYLNDVTIVIFPGDIDNHKAFQEAQNKIPSAGSSTTGTRLPRTSGSKSTWSRQDGRKSHQGGQTSPAQNKQRVKGGAVSVAGGSQGSGASSGKLALIQFGFIAKQNVDVIVNSASSELKLEKGAVSNSLLQAAGPRIQDECTMKYPLGIKPGDVVETRGYNLQCQEVFHTALAQYTPGAEQILFHIVQKCLKLASKKQYKTIALPVMGTGTLGYPHDLVAQAMLAAVDDFEIRNPSSSLREARIVVFDPDSQKAFQANSQRRQMKISTPTAKSPNVSKAAERALKIDDLNIVVKQGDITEEAVTAIVSSSNSSLDLTRGAVAQAILRKCGDKLTKECEEKVPDMDKNGFVWTEAYNMKCRHILHINTDRFTTTDKVFTLCLSEANNRGLGDVALPAFGTGLGATVNSVAAAFMEAAKQFSKLKRRTVSEVRLVLFERDMTEEMFRELKQLADKDNKKNSGWFRSYLPGASTKIEVVEDNSNSWETVEGPVDIASFVVEHKPKTMYVYAETERTARKFISTFEEIVQEKTTHKSINFEPKTENFDEQVRQIEEIGTSHNVKITVNRRNGVIELHGFNKDVLEAFEEITQFLQDDLLASMVQWSFMEVTSTGTEPIEYPANINAIIEKAYLRKKKTVEFSDSESNVYYIDFDQLQEYPKGDDTTPVAVLRRNKQKDNDNDSSIKVPSHWTEQKEDLWVVPLKSTDSEYVTVVTNFSKSIGNMQTTVTGVDRVQSKALYLQYQAKKEQMQSLNPGKAVEMALWHGTAADSTDNINRWGFNRSYCGKNATMYGDGVYFAVNSGYSASSTYSKPNPNTGERKMYQCRVLVGHACQGSQGMKTPPKRPGSGNAYYDSATDNLKNPTMYVIFYDTQAYPEYIITFK